MAVPPPSLRPTPPARAHDPSSPISSLLPTPPPDVPSPSRHSRGFPIEGDPRCSTDFHFCPPPQKPSSSIHVITSNSSYVLLSTSTRYIDSSSTPSNISSTVYPTASASGTATPSAGTSPPLVHTSPPPRPFDHGPPEHARSQASQTGIIAAATLLALLAFGVFLWFLRRGTFGSGTLFGFKYGDARFAAGASGTGSGRGAAGKKMSDEEMAQMGAHNVTSLDMSNPPAYPGSASISALLAAKRQTKPSPSPHSSSYPSSSATVRSAPTLALALDPHLLLAAKAPASPTWSASPSAFDNAYSVRAGSALSRTSGSATLVSQPTGASVASASSSDDPFRSADDPHLPPPPQSYPHPPLRNAVDPFRSSHDRTLTHARGHTPRLRHGADPFRSDEDSVLEQDQEREPLPRYESPRPDVGIARIEAGPPRLSLASTGSDLALGLGRSLSRTSATSGLSGVSAVSAVSATSGLSAGASTIDGVRISSWHSSDSEGTELLVRR